jgi:hypothetical protein
MKKIIFILAIIVSVYNLNAQRVVEKQITVKPTAALNLKLDFADTIRIKQSKDNNIRIKAIVDINDNQNNDKYELITTESEDYVKVMAKIHDMESIRIPCRNYRGISYDCHGGKCLTMNISYEIEVPSIANLQIETISGDIIVENSKYPVNIKSISGIIDFSIPSNSNSDIRIETVTGGVYTNHEFNKSSDEFDGNPGGTDAIFRIGSGGTRIKLVTVSGDIFVRKI